MLNYVKGNLFDHLTYPVAIVHVVNNEGRWGAGFTESLTHVFPESKKRYLEVFEADCLTLGTYFPLKIGRNSLLINLVAQKGVYNPVSNQRPADYEYLYTSLENSAKEIIKCNLPVFMPKILSGLARGKWSIVEVMIKELYKDIDVTVFEL